MLNGFYSLSYLDVIYAALMELVITQIILSFSKMRKTMARERLKQSLGSEFERLAVIKHCKNLLPVSTVNFRGKVFTAGMRVRITTLQKRIIEGEFIGKNDSDVLCVITGQHIIAHEINKIEDMTEM